MPDHNVKPERTGWRDEWLSRQHRTWGWDVPMVDIDFLVWEYDQAKAVALIEYKAQGAAMPDFSKANYRTLIDVAARCEIPFAVVRYHSEQKLFFVIPGNESARFAFTPWKIVSEYDYVQNLYRLRKREMPEAIGRQLSRQNQLIANGAR